MLFDLLETKKKRCGYPVSGSGSTVSFTNSRNVDSTVTDRARFAPVIYYSVSVRVPVETERCHRFDRGDGAVPGRGEGWTRQGQRVCQGEFLSVKTLPLLRDTVKLVFVSVY